MAILVIKLKHIGDTLLVTPAIRHLKQCFPGEPVCALVRGGCEATLANNPDLAEVFTFGRLDGPRQTLRERWAEIRAFFAWLRRWRFRLAVDFSSSDRGALCAWLSRASERVAYEPVLGGFLGKRWLYTRRLHDDRASRHEAEKDWRLAEFATGRTGEPSRLIYRVTDTDAAWAEAHWRGLEGGTRALRVVCHATSRWMFKCWQDEKVAATLDDLLARHGGLALLSTGQNEQEKQRALHIRSLMHQRAEMIAPPLSLPRLAAVMRAADLFIGVDSGPMHLAAAVDVPTVALFGPTPPACWRPWSDRAVVVEGDCACRKVNKYHCPKDRTMKCLEQIEPGSVIAAAEEMLTVNSVRSGYRG